MRPRLIFCFQNAERKTYLEEGSGFAFHTTKFCCVCILVVNNVLMCNFIVISVCKDPPYKVEESGYAGFILPIEVYFKNKVSSTMLLTANRTEMSVNSSWSTITDLLVSLAGWVTAFLQEEPKKVRFDYDLFLHLEGHPPVNHLRCEKLTFNNPTEEFRRKLLKAGGVRVPRSFFFFLWDIKTFTANAQQKKSFSRGRQWS